MSRASYGLSLGAGGYNFAPSVTANNEGFLMVMPKAYVRGTSNVGAAIVLHGAGGSALTSSSGGGIYQVCQYLADTMGIPVAAIDAGSNGPIPTALNPDTWGNDSAMAAMTAAFNWATRATNTRIATGSSSTTLTDSTQAWTTNYWQGRLVTAGTSTGRITSNTATVLTVVSWTGGTPATTAAYSIPGHPTDIAPLAKTNKVILIGSSMGSWIARNWASRNPTKVACIVDLAGVVDGTWQYTTGGGGTKMDLAYGAAAPTIGTTTGTAGAQTYQYQVVSISALGDGTPSAASVVFNGVAVASLGATPNTVNWTQPAANTSAQKITGYKILRSIDGGATYQNIATVGVVATFSDNVVGAGSAYTALTAPGVAIATGAYTTNGVNANPSYDPLAATNLNAALKAIPLQYWWSANDNGSSTGSGVAGTVNTQVQTFATAYGANCQLQEIPGDPIHNNTAAVMGATPSAMAVVGSFINANRP